MMQRPGSGGPAGHVVWMTLLLALVLAPLSGCLKIRSPRAHVQSVAVTGQTDEGARVEVVLRISNPNPVALPVRSASYEVVVDDLGTFSFIDHPPVTLPPRGEQVIVLPAAFLLDDTPIAGRTVRVGGRLRYQPPGELRQLMTDYWIPLPGVVFARQATLEAPVDD